MPTRILPAAATVLLSAGLVVATAAATRPPHPPASAVSFAEDVAPIFERSCIRCHGGIDEGERRYEGGLDLTTWEGVLQGSEFGTVVTPGDPDDSLLLEMIETGEMPDEGDPLSAEEIETVRSWIAEGAENN